MGIAAQRPEARTDRKGASIGMPLKRVSRRKEETTMKSSRVGMTSTPASRVRHVRWGDTVRAHYMAWLEDGTLIDTSIYGEPLVFTAGRHTVIQGLEHLVIGMVVGESKTEKIPPDWAFGAYRADLSCQVSGEWLRAHRIAPEVGVEIEVQQANGASVPMVVADVAGDLITLDANHRLAGRTVTVQVEVLDIVDEASSVESRPPSIESPESRRA